MSDPSTADKKPDLSDAREREPHPGSGQPEPKREKLEKPARLDPVRYGDWEKNGRCIDF